MQRLAAALSDRYRIERELGQGGMATVYLAQDVKHDRHVALKVLDPDLAATIGVERFLSEIRVTANLQHPNILGLFDSGIADGQAYYVMPFVDGESLRDRLMREKQLPVADALRIATGIAAALEYAHAHGVIHRDIKPENILLQSGQPVVADFGIALAVQQAGGQRLTQTGMSLGTPQYMSPEQAMGERSLDARTDIYALGVITYEMLAGEPPFTGPNAQAIVSKVLTEKPRPLGQLRETVSPSVEAAVHRAMQKLPADRFANAVEFTAALESGSGTLGAHGTRFATSARPATRRRSHFIVPAVIIAGASITAFLFGKRFGAGAGGSMDWRGELLGGPVVSLRPVPSHDGQYVTFQAMIDGEAQLGVLKPGTGDWKVLTTDRTHGDVTTTTWSHDNSTIYFDRFRDVPKGIYSISPLGTGERLVLANASEPDALPDGSLIAAIVNADRNEQLIHFWPESRHTDTLPVVASLTTSSFFHSFPNGREVAFYGRPAAQKDSVDQLYVIDLSSKRIRRLSQLSSGNASSLAVSPDNKFVYVVNVIGPVNRIVAIRADGSSGTEVRATLTLPTFGIEIGADGSLYFDQYSRPMAMTRYSISDHSSETVRLPQGTSDQLILPDNSVLVRSRLGQHSQVMVLAKGKQPVPFMATSEGTGGPMALLGRDQVLLQVGSSMAIVSAATGQLVRRIPTIRPTSAAGSPDGKTIYYVESKTVWAMPSSGGPPRKIRAGDFVAVDPAGQYLVVKVDEADGVRLFHVPLDGSAESEISVKGDIRIAASMVMYPNAIGPGGRLLLQVVPPSSWFWPSGILDPATGKIELLPSTAPADMFGGWSPDGHVVYFPLTLESVLWRFRPATSKDSL